ncbi:hypothetical protein BGZ97_010897 [Linnemannia gamsii]|uniref:Arrestin C-terminal-like domain-containing protein n=1 Tax=Linnemannia gamsii TaxID=64522 RepID=A0A9P6UNK0_9FUNG|nr:hypothetical protein BGZ97_010897 [Linnemannia gamsii]
MTLAIFTGQNNDPKLQRLMFPWTGTQGPIINGKLIITNREDTTLKALTLTFKAKISCSWSETKGNKTHYYNAKKPLLEKQWVFLEGSQGKLHMLRANQTYTYDFQLALPVNLPNSLAMSSGKIEYMFTANGKRSTFQLDLNRERLVEIYQSLPPSHSHCVYPIQQTAEFENALSYLVQLPHKAFHHGSTIPVTIRLNPLPSSGARWHVTEVSMKVKEYFWFIVPGKAMRHEKRSLVDTKLGSGNWPLQAGPLERTMSIKIPAVNIMSTIDTELVKCTHKLKMVIHININGHSKKLPADFDVYIPGPFPPGQGPSVTAPVQQQQLVHQQQQQQPPLPQPHQQQLPSPAAQAQTPYQQPFTPMSHQQAPYTPTGQYPLPAQQPTGMSLPTPLTSPSNYPLPAQPPSSAYSQPSSQPFAPPPAPFSQSTAFVSSPAPSVPTPGDHSNPYSQGYGTPTSANSYPMVSSQGYPTPAMPPMPSPTFANYPMPPSPVPAPTSSAAPNVPSPAAQYVPMPIPMHAPTIPLAQSGVGHVAIASPTISSNHQTPVMTSNYLQQQQQFAASPKVDSPKGNVPALSSSHRFDDTIKVNLDDIKLPSTPSTPATGAAAAAVVAVAAVPARSKNPQLRETTDEYTRESNNGQSPMQSSSHYTSTVNFQVPLVPTQPQGPHAIKESSEDQGLYSYQPPPPTASIGSPSSNVVKPKDNNDLSSRFSQMGLSNNTSASLPSPVATMSSTTPSNGNLSGFVSPTPSSVYTQPPPVPSPAAKPAALSQNNGMHNPMSPVSAAATGAVVASLQQQQQQQHQQQLQYQQQQLQQQQQQHLQQQYQLQQQQQHFQVQAVQQVRKQQVWIPMYHTLSGKTYVQYVLAP